MKSYLQYLDTTDCSRLLLPLKTEQPRMLRSCYFPLHEGSNKKSAPSIIYCLPVSYYFRAAKARIYPQNHGIFQVIAPDKRTTTTRKSHTEVECCTDEEMCSEQRNQESLPIRVIHFYVILEKLLCLPMGKRTHSRPYGALTLQ